MSEIAWAGCEPTIVVANVALRVLAGRGAANDLQPLSFFIASIASKTCWWSGPGLLSRDSDCATAPPFCQKVLVMFKCKHSLTRPTTCEHCPRGI